MRRAAALRVALAKQRYHDKDPSPLTIACALATSVPTTLFFIPLMVHEPLAQIVFACINGYAWMNLCEGFQDRHRKRELDRAITERAKIESKQ